MAMRPVSFLAQAAAQRQQTRENESQREFQKDQALRDFGMNIGQSLVASLGNFGAQAGAQAIAFNREEPFKMLESGVNPAPGVSVKQPVGTGASDMLSKAATARSPLQAQTPATPAPVAQPAPSRTPVTSLALEFARAGGPAPSVKPPQPGPVSPAPAPAFDPFKAMRDPSSVLPRQAAPVPSAPTPAPSGVMAGLKQVGAAGLRGPSAPPPIQKKIVSQSSSQRGDAPEAQAVKLRALQEMEKITQRWLGGEPLQFVKKDGTPAEPREAAFAEAYQMKQDLTRLDMLSKAGLIEAEEAKAVAYQIKAQAEGGAATTKAESDRQVKIAQAFKYGGEGAKAITGNYDKRGNELSNAPNEGRMTAKPNEFPTFQTEPDRAARPRVGTGGAPKQSLMFPDATEVWAQQYSETKNDLGQNLRESVVVPEEYLDLADKKLNKFRYIERADAPAIDKALKAGDWQTAQTLFKDANARHAKKYAAQTEAVTPPTVLANAADAAADEVLAEETNAFTTKLAAERSARVARNAAVKEALRIRAGLQNKPTAAELFPSAKNPKKLQTAADAILAGKAPPSINGLTPAMLSTAQEKAKSYLDDVVPAGNRFAEERQLFLDNGGDAAQWDKLVPRSGQAAPGSSELSPGQFPPPGDESKVDDLFQKIESQPWSAERKRRVFLTRAREAGLA